MVCTVPYVLAGDFCMGSLQPTFFWRRSDLPALGKQEQDGMRVHLCLPHSVCVYLCARVHAQTRPGQPFPISARRFEKRGRKSQSSSYYSSLKANGEEAEEELGEGGEGGREGCRKEEREPNGRDEGGMGGIY